MLRRFCLVGLFSILNPGTIEQLVYATLFSILYLVVQLQANPYSSVADNFVALISSGTVVTLFFACVVSKGALLVTNEDVRSHLSLEMKHIYNVRPVLIMLIMFVAAFLTLASTSYMMIHQAAADTQRRANEARAKKARRLKYVKTDADVLPSKIKPNEYHLFLSHVWGTGQVQTEHTAHAALSALADLRAVPGT